MIYYGILDGGATGTVLERRVTETPDPTWVELPYGVDVGWSYNGSVWTGPGGESPPPEPPPVIRYRYLLTGWEWVSLWSDSEWDYLQAKRKDGTDAGRQLNRLLDAIRWTDSINVLSANLDGFYNWILNNYPTDPQGKVDELRQGLPVDGA